MMSSIGSSTGPSPGQIAQMQAQRAQAFGKADADSSGGLNLDEFKSLLADAPKGPNGQGGAGGAQGAASTKSADQIEAMFKAADTNGDGQVTQSELDASIKAHHHHGGGEHISQLNGDGSTASLQALLKALEGSGSTSASASTSNSGTSSGGSGSSSTGDAMHRLLSQLQAALQPSSSAVAVQA